MAASARKAEARSKVELGIEKVTPAKAQKWLEGCNIGNRNISQRVVEKYARDMVNGHWKPVGDPIRFDRNGVLRDGQHRCLAIVKTGQSVEVAVFRGMDPEDFQVVDTGKKRTAGNVLQTAKYPNPNSLAAVLQLLDAYEDGQFATANSSPNYQYTSPEILELAEEYEEYGIEGDVRAMLAHRRDCPLTDSVVAAARFLQRQVSDEDTVEEFWDGVNYTARRGDARFSLRDWAKKNKGRGSVSRRDVSRQLFAIFYAWNQWRRGKNARLSDSIFIKEEEVRNDEGKIISPTVWKDIPDPK